MKKRLMTITLLFCLMLFGLVGLAAPASAAPGNILPPFNIGESWNICQGYSNPAVTHTGTSEYGLDLTGAGCDNSATGRTVRAPIGGTIYYYQALYGNLCINVPGGRSLTLTHINSTLTSGSVSAGQAVGTVAAAGQRGNNGVAHIHLQMWATPNCYSSSGIPFDAAHGTRICGAPDLTTAGIGSNGKWSGTSFVGSSCDGVAGSGVGTRMLGDVNGDGAQDAVVMFKDTGTAMVALSNGSSFNAPQSWSHLHSVNAERYFLADVDGDGLDDLVAGWLSTGKWFVSSSSGSGFWPASDWATAHGIGTSAQWVKDVNGDGKADMVTFDRNTGDWWASISSGSGFYSPIRWISGHGYGSNGQQLDDFNGDGKADAAVYFSGQGKWYVSLSHGSGFNGFVDWSSGHGLNSNAQYVGDVNGDGKADAAYFFSSNGHWDAGMSEGGGFWTPTAWAHGHGIGTSQQFLGDVNGDGKADMVTFDRNTGDWWASISSGSGFYSPIRWAVAHGANS